MRAKKIAPNPVRQNEPDNDCFRGKTLAMVKKEGWEEGWEEGWKEGRKEERYHIISQCLLSGMSAEDLAEKTNIPIREIRGIEELVKASI